MRGIKGMIWETSVLDADEGIRFRNYTIPRSVRSFFQLPRMRMNLFRRSLSAAFGYWRNPLSRASTRTPADWASSAIPAMLRTSRSVPKYIATHEPV
ncbi:hypothetical protein BASA60_001641 [Batrachochytrium salamandrivorans]|nr:hypothetical protein BASA60_001641 [Batrachochytrium salamandrivorans]